MSDKKTPKAPPLVVPSARPNDSVQKGYLPGRLRVPPGKLPLPELSPEQEEAHRVLHDLLVRGLLSAEFLEDMICAPVEEQIRREEEAKRQQDKDGDEE